MALTSDLAEAFQQATKSWSQAEHLAFVEAFVGERGPSIPNAMVLTAINLTSAPEGGMADILISRYNDSTNNAMRTAVLDLWVAASISGERERAQLFTQIAIRMLELKSSGRPNAEAVRAVLRRMPEIGAPPKGIRKAFNHAVKHAVEGTKDLENSAVTTLERVGYRTRVYPVIGVSGGSVSRFRLPASGHRT